MSGRNQHHIPQVLLRGFSLPNIRKLEQVAVYSRDRRPYTPTTEGVGAERDFYSTPSRDGTATLDDVITHYENKVFAPQLQALRESSENLRPNAQAAAEVVSHLSVRSDFIRRAFTATTGQLLTRVPTLMLDPEVFRSSLLIDAPDFDPWLSGEIQRILSLFEKVVAASNGMERSLLEKFFRYLFRERFNELVQNSVADVDHVLTQFSKQLNERVQEGHCRALQAELAPQARRAPLERLHWSFLQAVAGDHFILPDCLAIASTRDSSSEFRPYASQSSEAVHTLFFPISSSRLLVGSITEDLAIGIPADINARLAACSLNFFVSSRMDEACLALSRTIGETADEEIEGTVESAIDDLRPAARALSLKPPDFGTSTQYQVILDSWADEESEKAIISSIHTILIATDLRPGLLETFVFTEDFRSRAREMLQFESDDQTEAEYLRFLITEKPTLRGHAFMKPLVAQGLLEPEGSALRSVSTYMIASAAARALYLESVSVGVPDGIHQRHEDEIARLEFDVASQLGTTYFPARLSARFYSDARLQYEEHAMHTFSELHRTLNSLRRSAPDPEHVETYIAAAVAGVRDLLVGMAQWLGHIDGTCPETDLDGELSELLSTEGLLDWARLLRRDLRAHDRQLGAWETKEHYSFLGRHGERLLWHFGVYPWKDAQGLARFQVASEAGVAQFRELTRFDMKNFTDTLRQHQPPSLA